MSSTKQGSLPDLEGRADIKVVVDSFYEKVQADEIIGFIFNDVAGVDWNSHLPKMYDFWETMIFQSGSYQGNPLLPHLDLAGKAEMGTTQFTRWKELFFETVDQHYAGANAEHLKGIAADMAQVMLSKISGVPRGMTFAPNSPKPPENL